MKYIILLLTAFYPALLGAQTPVFEGQKSSWHEGFERYDLIMDENTLVITAFKAPEGEGFGVKDPPPGTRRCIVVVPKHPAPDNPWSWRGCYWDHQPQTEVELLKRGFFIAYISANATLKPGKEWDAWYAYLTGKGLSKKPAFIGMSRGGEYEYMWATAHPDAVSCIYGDNPAIDRDALTKLGGLAKNDVPLLHVCGSIDPLYLANTAAAENIYRAFGGRMSVMIKEGFGHHPHSLNDPKPIADFIEQSFREKAAETPTFVQSVYGGPGAAGATRSDTAGYKPPKTWYYGKAESYRWVAAEKTYITTRGAFFSGCYARYQLQIPGVDAFTTVIVPSVPAAGNPWVFRPDYLQDDDLTDQALLAKGWAIVTGAVPYNYDGPVLAQWNAIYAYLTGYGFSLKPVMAGRGDAAGEAIAWAIANPGKVACIYAENPILHNKLLIPTQPLDTLAPLAKAGVPLLFVCGSLDPSVNEQARVAEARYRKLGGTITVLVRKGEGHFLRLADPAPVLDFIGKYVK